MLHLWLCFPYIKTVIRDIQHLIFTSLGIYAIPCIRHILTVTIRCYTETVIQIYKIYTVTRIRCCIGIISRILTDSQRMNKRYHGLHVFIESIYNNIRESYSKNLRKN